MKKYICPICKKEKESEKHIEWCSCLENPTKMIFKSSEKMINRIVKTIKQI